MGDSYVSEDEMITEATEYEHKEQKQFEEIKKDLPSRVIGLFCGRKTVAI